MTFKFLKLVECDKLSPLHFYRRLLEQYFPESDQSTAPATTIDQVKEVENGLIIGSFCKSYPLKRHSRPNSCIKIIVLYGALKNEVNIKFQVALFNEFASEAEKVNFKDGDLLAFYKPVLRKHFAVDFMKEKNVYGYLVYVGEEASTDQNLSFFFAHKKNNPFPSTASHNGAIPSTSRVASLRNSPSQKQVSIEENRDNKVIRKTLKRFSDISFVDVSKEKRSRNDCANESSDSSETDISERSANSGANRRVTRNSKLASQPDKRQTRSSVSPKEHPTKNQSVTPTKCTDPKQKSSAATKVTSPLKKQANVANNAGQSSSKMPEKRDNVSEVPVESNGSVKNTVVQIFKSDDPKQRVAMKEGDGYQYTELKYLMSYKEVNTFGVILELLKVQEEIHVNRLLTMVTITDNTLFPLDFKVYIFHRPGSVPPIKKHQIIRLHRLKLETSQGKVDGRVFNGWDVLCFNRDDVDIQAGKMIGYTGAKSCTFKDSDKERILELRNWIDTIGSGLMETKTKTAAKQVPDEITESNDDKNLSNSNDSMILRVEVDENGAGSVSDEEEPPRNTMSIIEIFFESFKRHSKTVDLSELTNSGTFNFSCKVFNFRKLDGDRGQLIVSDGKICPLRLLSFPYDLDKYSTLDECIKGSSPKQNTLHVSILLENLTKNPMWKHLKKNQAIFMSNCKTPDKNSPDAGLLIKCDVSSSCILLIDSTTKGLVRKFMNTSSKKYLFPRMEHVMKRLPLAQPVSSPKKPVVSKCYKPARTCTVNLEKIHSIDKRAGESPPVSEEVVINESDGGNDAHSSTGSNIVPPVNGKDADVCSKTIEKNLEKNIDKNRDTEELASSQLSTCVSKMMKSNVPVLQVPSIMDVSKKDLTKAFARLTNKIRTNQTTDVNSLDDVLSPNSRRLSTANTNYDSPVSNGKSPARALNFSFEAVSPQVQDFDGLLAGTFITPPRKNRVGDVLESGTISEASDESTLDESTPDFHEFRKRNKAKVTPRGLCTDKVGAGKAVGDQENRPSPTLDSGPSLRNKKNLDSGIVRRIETSKSIVEPRTSTCKDRQEVSGKGIGSDRLSADDCNAEADDVEDIDDAATVITSAHKNRANDVIDWVYSSNFLTSCNDREQRLAKTNHSLNRSNEYLLLKIDPLCPNGDFAIVSGFCALECEKYNVIKSYPVTPASFFCTACKNNGIKSPLTLNFLMTFHLIHYETLEHVKALLHSSFAEGFLVCNVNKYVKDEATRNRTNKGLKKLLLHNAVLDEKNIPRSQKLSLILEPQTLNGKTFKQIVEFEIPKVFSS